MGDTHLYKNPSRHLGVGVSPRDLTIHRFSYVIHKVELSFASDDLLTI